MVLWLQLLCAAAAVVFGVLMLTQGSLYAAAVCFLACVLQSAVLLYLCGAALLATLLVLIYAGAVAVLIVVSIQTAESGRPAQKWSRPSLPRWLTPLGFLLAVVESAWLLARGQIHNPQVPVPSDLALGMALFGPYAAATEAVGLLMLFAALAVIGAPEER